MPSFFSKFKRKSNSHKAEATSPASPLTPPPATAPAPLSPQPEPLEQRNVVHTPTRHGRPSLDVEDVPPRTTSLAADPITSATGDMSSMRITPHTAIPPAVDSPPQLPPLHLHSDSLATTFTSAAHPTLVQSAIHEPTLEAQRGQLVDEIATAARARKTELSAVGRAAFAAAGMEVANGTLEVDTLYLKPVVQETIIIREHTETTTIIDQHIHHHHIYPKIQPISDPNPIRHEPRHRIFSALDGKWHEVIGDAAAIAILGEDAFYNGKKEYREVRKMALPGLGGELDELAVEPRVIEREGIMGQEMSSWHQLKGLAGAGTPSEMIGEGWMLPKDQIGAVQRTVGMAL